MGFKRSTIAFLAFASVISCKNSHKDADSGSVNPFDTTAVFNTQALSDADRAKLAAAKGKSVKPVSSDEIVSMVGKPDSMLTVYCFWNLLNEGSKHSAKAFNAIASKSEAKIKAVFVNMPNSFQKVEAVNLFIRENQLTGEHYILDKAEVGFFGKKIKPEFKGITTLPIFLVVNQSDKILLMYNQPFEEKELNALLQPLAMK